MMKEKRKRERRRSGVVEMLDGMTGYLLPGFLAFAAFACAFVSMSRESFIALLIAALCAVVLGWVLRRRKAAAEKRRVAEAARRMSEKGIRIKKGKRKGRLKHHEPDIMPLELRKAVRTGMPPPKAARPSPPRLAALNVPEHRS